MNHSSLHDSESKYFFKGIEVAITMKQLMTCVQAESCDQAVNGLSHGETPLSQPPVVQSGRDRQFGATSFENMEA